MPDSIGVTAKSFDGVYAEYDMTEDDMYVRAVVTSSRKSRLKTACFPEFCTAWTQPFC
jgi:hypothetical protein